MDTIKGESIYPKKDHVKVEAKLAQISLKDVPPEFRRKEAKEPLFLTRYE